MKLIALLLTLFALACAPPDAGGGAPGEEPEAAPSGAALGATTTCFPHCDPWPTPPAVDPQAAAEPGGAFCTNSQCFDGDSGPPKHHGADQWSWDQCSKYCLTCKGTCVAHCNGPHNWCVGY